MSWDDPFWWPHRVRIRPMLPGGGRGPRLSDSDAEVVAEVDDEFRLVRTADARETPSSARVTVPIDTHVPIRSAVTLWPGRAGIERTATVIAISRDENGDGLGSHLVLTLE
ncbi:MAG: hypothetical protein FJW64_15725 [Actinobacteria bacterium]|nr:hypothetical protein [Actinomycetota bacterium]